MTNSTENTIVAFHIGRGVRYNNAGHRSFLGENKIGAYTGDLFVGYENESNFKNRLGWDTSYDGVKCILDCFTDRDLDTLEEAYGITETELGEYIYKDGNGNSVGLTEADEETGVGSINEDNEYDTTYTCLLKDCSEDELQLIIDTDRYVDSEIVDYVKEQLELWTKKTMPKLQII